MAKLNRDDPNPPTSRKSQQEFSQIFERFSHPVNNFFSQRGFSREECQDLAQETFIGVYRGLGRFRNESSEGTWLFTIAANVWRNEIRRRATEKRSAEEVTVDAGSDLQATNKVDPLASLVLTERRKRLKQAIDELPSRMRRCLVLRVYHDLKYREIATVMQISLNTVRSTIFQATERLQERLVAFDEEGHVAAKEV